MKYPHGFLKKSALGFLSLMLLESAQPYAASREELGIPSPKDMEHHGDHIYRDGIDPQILTKTYARTITDKKGDIFEVMMVETYPYIPVQIGGKGFSYPSHKPQIIQLYDSKKGVSKVFISPPMNEDWALESDRVVKKRNSKGIWK